MTPVNSMLLRGGGAAQKKKPGQRKAPSGLDA
jgi:hypothetical protein